jgi:hypothetical protein
MISTRLHEFDSGVLHPSSPKVNHVPRLQAHRGLQKRYTRITAEEETLDTWNGETPRSPM